MPTHTPRTAILAVGVDPDRETLANAVGASDRFSEAVLAATFSDGYTARLVNEQNHGDGHTDPDIVRAWTAGWEVAVEVIESGGPV